MPLLRAPRTIPIAALTFAAIASTPSFASASGFGTARFGGEHGNPITTNPTAIYYNPAGIADSEGTHIFLDMSLAFRGVSYAHQKAGDPATTGDQPEPADAKGANYGESTLFNVIPAPMIGASTKIGGLAIGAGFYVPLGGTAVWDKNDAFKDNKKYAGPYDGVARWYIIDGTIISYYTTLAVAYHIEPLRLSIGVSGNLIRSQVHTVRARTATSDNDLNSEARALLNVSGWEGSFGVGATFEALPKTLWIGAAYQARPNVAGGSTLHGQLHQSFGGIPQDQDVDLHQDLPDSVRLGARFRPMENVELRLFGDWTRWSAFKSQCIGVNDQPCAAKDDGTADSNPPPIVNLPRNWNDSVGVRVGGSFWVKPELEVFTGLGFDSNAVPASTLEPSLVDFNTFSAALGARVQFIKNLGVALSYTHFFGLARNTAGESELYKGYKDPTRGPDAGGHYTQMVGVVNANIDISF